MRTNLKKILENVISSMDVHNDYLEVIDEQPTLDGCEIHCGVHEKLNIAQER